MAMDIWSASALVLFIIVINSLAAAGIFYLIKGRRKEIFWKAFLASVAIWVILLATLIIYLRLTIGEFL